MQHAKLDTQGAARYTQHALCANCDTLHAARLKRVLRPKSPRCMQPNRHEVTHVTAHGGMSGYSHQAGLIDLMLSRYRLISQGFQREPLKHVAARHFWHTHSHAI
eukprot:6184357-Pleurochrysis_carterae.AAC.2